MSCQRGAITLPKLFVMAAPESQVFSLPRLRNAEVSIMPVMASRNSFTPAFMIPKKALDMTLQDGNYTQVAA